MATAADEARNIIGIALVGVVIGTYHSGFDSVLASLQRFSWNLWNSVPELIWTLIGGVIGVAACRLAMACRRAPPRAVSLMYLLGPLGALAMGVTAASCSLNDHFKENRENICSSIGGGLFVVFFYAAVHIIGGMRRK